MRRALNDKPDSGGGSGLGTMLGMKGAVAGAAVGTNYLMDRKTDKETQAKREADAEMKRESRGVKKPANFDAIEESKQDAKDSADAKKQDKAYNESLTTENKAKGGMTAKFMSFSKTGKPAGMKKVTKMASGGMTASSRADGCATKGKTRGKMM
jgi:hypothetical protein